MDEVTYEEKRRAVSLLERLTSQARLELLRDGNLIVAPTMEASAEGVLISEVLGIFLFLFLLLGMVGFFHKETNCATQMSQCLRKKMARLLRRLRHKICRFDREWSREEDASSCDTSIGVYRDISSSDDIAGAEQKPPEAAFHHRTALLELFTDLELHQEVVRDSLRGYDAFLSRLNGPQSAAPKLKGILRPADAAPVHGRHKNGHHGHHGHHRHRHAPVRCDVIAETPLNGDVIAENGAGVEGKSEQNVETKAGQGTQMQSDCRKMPGSECDAQIDCDVTTQEVCEGTVEAEGKTEANHDVTQVANAEMAETVGDVSAEGRHGITEHAGRNDSPATARRQQKENGIIPEITVSDVTAENDQATQPTCEVSSETAIRTTPMDSEPVFYIASEDIIGTGDSDGEPLKEGPTLMQNGVLQDVITCRQDAGRTGPVCVVQMERDSTPNGDFSSAG